MFRFWELLSGLVSSKQEIGPNFPQFISVASCEKLKKTSLRLSNNNTNAVHTHIITDFNILKKERSNYCKKIQIYLEIGCQIYLKYLKYSILYVLS